MSEIVWLTPREVSERTKFAVGTLANWRSLGIGPAWEKVNGRIRYTESALLEWQITGSARTSVQSESAESPHFR